jgi:membrane protease YdiL (CAAX protease family)
MDLQTLALDLILLLFPVWFETNGGKPIGKALERVGLHLKDANLPNEIATGIGFGAVCFALVQIEGVLLGAVGLQDSVKVAAVLAGQSSFGILILVLLSPLAEEVFFRGFLQKRVGVVLSSLLFTALHYGYGSFAELVAALSISLAFGWFVRERKRNGIIPVVFAHVLLNAISVYAIFIH